MRRFVAVAVAITFMAGPAYAQMKTTNPKQHHQSEPEKKNEEENKKVNERNYKSALDRVPSQGEAFDPWANVREKPKPK